jgi:hypothetical protein
VALPVDVDLVVEGDKVSQESGVLSQTTSEPMMVTNCLTGSESSFLIFDFQYQT